MTFSALFVFFNVGDATGDGVARKLDTAMEERRAFSGAFPGFRKFSSKLRRLSEACAATPAPMGFILLCTEYYLGSATAAALPLPTTKVVAVPQVKCRAYLPVPSLVLVPELQPYACCQTMFSDDDDDGDCSFFAEMFIDEDYKLLRYSFSDFEQQILALTSGSTDHDLTGNFKQSVLPVAILFLRF